MHDLYKRYYRPENAILIFVGDVDPAAVEAKIKSKFGDWKGGGAAGAPLPQGKVDLSRPAAFDTRLPARAQELRRQRGPGPVADPTP